MRKLQGSYGLAGEKSKLRVRPAVEQRTDKRNKGRKRCRRENIGGTAKKKEKRVALGV